jgi:hypothetical protein
VKDPAEFAKEIWARFGSQEPFKPEARYDSDGDCLEFIAANEAFRGERLDKWVTVYRSRASGRVGGSLIKNIRELLARNPGLAIEIRSGPVQLSHFLQAPKFSATTDVMVRVYEEIIKEAVESNVEANLQTA